MIFGQPESCWSDQVEHQRVGEGASPLILVPLDGSAEATVALAAARLVAEISGGYVHVVHAADHCLSPEELIRETGLRPEQTVGLIFDQVIGPAPPAIVDAARRTRASLIVMTTRGHTAYQGRTVRPVVEEVLSRAPCPVLLVRPELAEWLSKLTGIRRILLPLDGAPSSAAVIGPALFLARQAGAAVDIVYVATLGPPPVEPGTLTAPYYVDQPQYEWPAWAQEFALRFGTCLGACPLPRPTHLHLLRGEPSRAIVAFAEQHDSDVIVLEWRGHLGPDHARTVKGVLSHAPCLVLLLRVI